MSALDAVLLGLVLGLAIVGAVLLRNEEKIREAWRRRHPETGPAGRGAVVGTGLFATINIGIAADDGGAFRIVLAAAWLLFFGISLLQYRRSQGST